MFDYICGVVTGKSMPYVVIETGGIGYLVHVPLGLYSELEAGMECKVYTRLIFGREGVAVYGFKTPEEREFFDVLRRIPNVGSRSALNILSFLSFDELESAIRGGKRDIIERVPGIGPKKAARIAMELGMAIKSGEGKTGYGSMKEDLLGALVALGYRKADVEDRLRSFEFGDGETLEDALKRFLSEVSRDRRRHI